MFSGVLGLPRVVRWFLGSSCISCWATCRASTAVAYSLLSGSSVMDTSLRLSTSLATGGGFGGGLVRCSVMDAMLKEMLESLALLGIVAVSGELCVFSPVILVAYSCLMSFSFWTHFVAVCNFRLALVMDASQLHRPL